jgi:hypothetical protein
MLQLRAMARLVLLFSLLALLGLVFPQMALTQSKVKTTKPTVTASQTAGLNQQPFTTDQQAMVFQIKGTANNTFFSLPQVHLQNQAAARRILVKPLVIQP